MKLILYTNNSRNDRVDKAEYLTNAKEYNATFLKTEEETNNIIIRLNDINIYKINYNYVYIEDLHRYYFIVNKTIINNNIIELSLHIDLLMSFKDSLLQQTCIIARQENKYDAYLNDDNIQVESYERIQTRLFPSGFSNSDASYILVICGGTNNG